jgi:hypothetical protein
MRMTQGGGGGCDVCTAEHPARGHCPAIRAHPRGEAAGLLQRRATGGGVVESGGHGPEGRGGPPRPTTRWENRSGRHARPRCSCPAEGELPEVWSGAIMCLRTSRAKRTARSYLGTGRQLGRCRDQGECAAQPGPGPVKIEVEDARVNGEPVAPSRTTFARRGANPVLTCVDVLAGFADATTSLLVVRVSGSAAHGSACSTTPRGTPVGRGRMRRFWISSTGGALLTVGALWLALLS